MEKRVKMQEQESLYIERIYYELLGITSLLKTMLTSGHVEINEKLFEKAMSEYIDKYVEYNICFTILSNKYLNYEIKNNIINADAVSIDFDTQEIIGIIIKGSECNEDCCNICSR